MNEIIMYKQLIDEKEYFDAHEVFETLWFPIRKQKLEYVFVLKGFINAAVSMELFKRRKVEQSKKVHKIYIKYVTQKRLNQLDNRVAFRSLKLFIDQKFTLLYNE